jgi:hypothetical protein
LIQVEKLGLTDIIFPNATDEPLILYTISFEFPLIALSATSEHRNMLLTDVI